MLLDDLADDRTLHPDAPPGKARKYALVERERRFLLERSPSGTPARRVLIEDRYVRGTRIRLRRMTDLEEDAASVYKLTQKVPGPDGGPGLITTMYLSLLEFDTVAALEADTIRKVRSSYPPLVVDTFEGPLRGLVIAEVEFEDRSAEAAFSIPLEAVAEVTTDPRFTGGNLARLTAEATAALLTTFGLAR